MQDSRFPTDKKAGEAQPENVPALPAERRRRREVLNEQLRAIYDSYAASEIPPRLLDLASKFEEQAGRHLQPGRTAPGGPRGGQTAPRDRSDGDA